MRTVRPIDKGRPELGYGSIGQGQLAATKVYQGSDKARDPSRQSIDNQISQTAQAITTNLKQIARLVQRGRYDKAGIVCEIVARQRLRLHELAMKRQELLDKPALQDEPVNRKPTTKTVRKPKRYKRWADK